MRRWFLFPICLLLLFVGSVFAQNPSFPMILLIDGDLWTRDSGTGEFIQLTTHGHAGRPVVSPNGQYIAYARAAQITLDAIERDGGMSGAHPSDVWLYEVATGEARQITAQPPDASFFQENLPDNALVRGIPTWSPDSTQLAWTNLVYPTGNFELGVHNLITGETVENPIDVPEQYAIPSPLAVYWGDGIMLVSHTYDREISETDSNVYVLEPDGSIRWILPFESDSGRYPAKRVWVRDEFQINGHLQDYFYLHNPESGDYLVDTQAGEIVPFEGQVEQYHRFAPNGLIAVHEHDAATNGDSWLIRYPDGDAIRIVDADDGFFVMLLAPDSETITLINYGELGSGSFTLWDRGLTTPIATTGQGRTEIVAATWGPVQWRLSADGQQIVEPPVSVQQCDGFVMSRLAVGGIGAVIPGLGANNVRDRATASGMSVGEIPPDGIFMVLDGPECADGYAWWYVDYYGVVGWTAEGADETYWLEPR